MNGMWIVDFGLGAANKLDKNKTHSSTEEELVMMTSVEGKGR